MTEANALLVLEDGSLWKGFSFGASGITVGEVVFNTATTGYQEMLTDCSYASQILTLTYPHIGNVGINFEDNESDRIWLKALLVRQYSEFFSNWRAKKSLGAFLKEHNIIGISNLDTRALTHRLRDKGAMIGYITTNVGDFNKPSSSLNFVIEDALQKINAQKLLSEKDFTKEVSIKHIKEWTKTSEHIHSTQTMHIVIYDFGLKYSIPQTLINLGCKVTVIPANTSIKDLQTLKPDAIVLSNGPGDPRVFKDVQTLIKSLLSLQIPIFGICLGHQLLALALGASVAKMKFGHHGANHPVQDVKTKEVFITSQNHGYVVSDSDLPEMLEVTHRSLFDGTIQGLRHKERPIFSFQGHPEAGPGPKDASILFSHFINQLNPS